jgi:hypothetical protein
MKWPVHPESTMDISCGSRSGSVKQSSNIVLFFKVSAPAQFFVGLTTAHVVSPSGFSLVALLGEVATQTGVSLGDIVPVCPTLIVWRRVKTVLPSSFSSFLIKRVPIAHSEEKSVKSHCVSNATRIIPRPKDVIRIFQDKYVARCDKEF